MFDSKLPISYYKEIASLNEAHHITIVQHRETGRIYLQKVLQVYNLAVYEQLFCNPIKYIPRIYAMYEENETLTLIEEYIPGDSLEEILAICHKFPAADTVKYMIKLCDILTDLHTASPVIIHRDIKPSNVMLTEDERIILIDLNAAKQMHSEKERDTRLLGTKGFAAPEQFGFGSSVPQTDIYGMGNLMTVLLTGGNTSDALPESPLTDIIKKCLEINPNDRYSSTRELKAALEKVLRKL